ncbi:MAG: hypothetical protein AB8B66_03130 [Rickettsiaceae bacterium]
MIKSALQNLSAILISYLLLSILTTINVIASPNDNHIKLMEDIVQIHDTGGFDNDPVAKQYAADIKKGYNEMQEYERKRNERLLELEIHKEVMRSAKSSPEKDMYPELEQEIMKQYGISQTKAHNMIEEHDPRVDQVWNMLVQKYYAAAYKEAKIKVTNRSISREH